MSLELINALASLLTVCIIAATAIAAIVQLRHLRAGNQIAAMLAIGEELSDQRFRDANRTIVEQYTKLADDAEFRAYNFARDSGAQAKLDPDFEEVRRAISFVCNAYEELGILVKNGIVDKELFLDRYSWVIFGMWRRIDKAVADARHDTGQAAVWENFEYLAVLSEAWLRDHPSAYPK